MCDLGSMWSAQELAVLAQEYAERVRLRELNGQDVVHDLYDAGMLRWQDDGGQERHLTQSEQRIMDGALRASLRIIHPGTPVCIPCVHELPRNLDTPSAGPDYLAISAALAGG